MKEFIEKLISRLEEKENEAVLKAPNTSDISNIEYQKWMMKSYGFKESIEIINELAEEYNNGWIPCSERLPDKKGFYVVTQERYSLDGKHKLLRTEVCADVLFNPTNQKWGRSNNLKVIAWQPLPQPYKEEGGENDNN